MQIGTHDDDIKGHVLQPLQPFLSGCDTYGSHFFGRDAVVGDDLVVLVDHALTDVDADDRLGVFRRQLAGDETCNVEETTGPG